MVSDMDDMMIVNVGIEKINVFWVMVFQYVFVFGIKIFVVIVFWVIGCWLIGFVVGMVQKFFEW